MIGVAGFFGIPMRFAMRNRKWVLLTLALAAGALSSCRKPAHPSNAAASRAAADPPGVQPDITNEKIEQSLTAAQEYIQSEDPIKAQAILITLIQRAPREVRARELYGQTFTLLALQTQRRGNAQAEQQFRDRAYEQYQAAVELDPNSAGLQQSAGMMALAAGNTGAALGHFQTAGKLDPKSPQHPLYEAQVLIQAKRYDEARACLERVLALDPDEAIAHASLAIISLDQGQYDEALKHIAEARRIQPDDLGLRAQQAKIYRRKGDPQKALQLLIGLSTGDRATDLIAFEIAASYDQLGQPMNAARAWQHCFEVSQTNPKAWLAAVHIGEYLLKAGERDQASVWLQQAKFAAPNAPEVKALESAITGAGQG